MKDAFINTALSSRVQNCIILARKVAFRSVTQ